MKNKDVDLIAEAYNVVNESASKPRLSLKRLVDTNEWKVQWIENGKVNEDKSYYTDDKQDAVDTMAEMQKKISVVKENFGVVTNPVGLQPTDSNTESDGNNIKKYVMVYVSDVPIKDAKRVIYEFILGDYDTVNVVTRESVKEVLNDLEVENKGNVEEKNIMRNIFNWMNENSVDVIVMNSKRSR